MGQVFFLMQQSESIQLLWGGICNLQKKMFRNFINQYGWHIKTKNVQ